MPDTFSSLWKVYKVNTASQDKLFMFKHWRGKKKKEVKFRTSELVVPWKNKQKISNVSHIGNQPVSLLINEKKKSFVDYEFEKINWTHVCHFYKLSLSFNLYIGRKTI